MDNILNVFLYGRLAGVLSSENGSLSFYYDPLYLKYETATPLSASMPLQEKPFDHRITSAFFSGLLPDEYVRKHLAKYLQVSEKNTFGLLKAIGGECAGAVSLLSPGSTLETPSHPTYRILSKEEAHTILTQLEKRPFLAGEDDIRISGAGAQDKMMIAFSDSKIAIPTHNTPSTHIIKPAIKNLEQPVQNEFFCMQLAKAIGLSTPNSSILWLKDEPFYLVERYDRIQTKHNLTTRIHQEDFCQALHIPSEQKYENEGGPNLTECFKLLDTRIESGFMAGSNKIHFLKAVIFNFLIGNGDAHAKNFSILYAKEAEQLAPLYDIICTVVYSNHFKAKMAMKLSNCYKFREVTLKHFERLSEITGFKPSFIIKEVQTITEKTLKKSEELKNKLNVNQNTQSPIYEQILEVIKAHSAQLND